MPKKILVIDDDLTTIKVLQSHLTKEGFEVAAAMNGQRGLEELATMTPDLIILDVQMPGMDGYTFLLELRKLGKFDQVPIIVLTAHKDMELIFKFHGVKSYIVKPVNFDVLLEKMKALGLCG